jgi:hypothetical protein
MSGDNRAVKASVSAIQQDWDDREFVEVSGVN